MAKLKESEFGIKYKIIKLEKDKCVLYPVCLVKGIETEDGFKTNDGELLPYVYEEDSLKGKYTVDMIFEKPDLEFVYEYTDGDEDFLGKYFYDDFKDTMIYIVDNPNDNTSYRNEINLRVINEDRKELAFVLDRTIPSVVLNENAINNMLEGKDINEIKLILEKYKRQLQEFKDYNKNKGITRISVVDGKVDTVETKRTVEKEVEEQFREKNNNNTNNSYISDNNDVSFQGLKNYIKERVLGHDEEIDTFCQKLYMNYTALEGENVESILLVGPTGVGKTETVKAACEYLDIPSFSVNASNIVPQGIKGMSIEDVIVGLFERAGYDEAKAQRGLLFLDEFDKLNDSDLEIKSAVKNILLTFTAGGVFPIDNERYTFQFDSSMTNKVYAGVFENITNSKEKHIGFGDYKKDEDVLSSEEAMREKIISSGYFTLEELSRITTILGYKDLDTNTKKRILLDSKLSELALKRERYKRQFNVDLEVDDSYLDTIIESLSKNATGMRSVNNLVKRTLNNAERELLENNNKGKKLVLTSKTVHNPKEFDII